MSSPRPPVAARRNGLNAAPFRPPFVEHPPQCRDLHRQVGSLDDRPPPDGRHDLFFGDQIARPFDEQTQNIEGLPADGDRNKNAALIAPGQALALPIEAKFLEQKYVGRGEHPLPLRHSSSSPALRKPAK